MEITKEMFTRFEGVRVSGVTNMFDIKTVSNISGLTKEQCKEIMYNYSDFKNEFLGEKNEKEI